MKHFVIATLSAGLLAAPAAFAQTNDSHTITLSYTHLDLPGTSAHWNVGGIAIDGRVHFSPQFSLGYDLNFSSFNASTGGFSLDITDVELSPRYHMNNQIWFGAYASRLALGGTGRRINTGGIEMGYEAGAFEGAISLGQSRLNGSTDNGTNDLALRFRYAPASEWEIFGSALFFEVRPSGNRGNAVGLGGAYSFSNGVNLFGGLKHLEVQSSDFTQGAIGISYTFRQSAVPITLSAELSRLNGSFTGNRDVDQFAVFLSIPLGGTKADRVPHGSITGGIRNGFRDAYGTLISSNLFP